MNPLLIIRSAQELITSRTQTRSGFIEAALAKNKKGAQAESTVHMLNWAIRSVKFLGVEFDQSEDEEIAVSDTTHL